MVKLTLPPLQKGYAIEKGVETISVDFGGGASLFRPGTGRASQEISVNWSLDSGDYNYLREFYFIITKSGSIPFSIDLIVNDAESKEHIAYFIPGSLRLDSIEGGDFNCSATLEVQQPKTNTNYDETVIMLFEEYGSSSGEFISEIDYFANSTLMGLSKNV